MNNLGDRMNGWVSECEIVALVECSFLISTRQVSQHARLVTTTCPTHAHTRKHPTINHSLTQPRTSPHITHNPSFSHSLAHRLVDSLTVSLSLVPTGSRNRLHSLTSPRSLPLNPNQLKPRNHSRTVMLTHPMHTCQTCSLTHTLVHSRCISAQHV